VWTVLTKNAMESDFSWTASAKKYLQIFESIRQGKIRSSDK
jgi:glycogen synthase